MGCATSHLNALKEAASQGRAMQRPLALILEDDIDLVDDFVVKLFRLLKTEAPCDWEAISLKSYAPIGECVSPRLSRVHPDGNEPMERCRKGSNWGFFAMLYQVRSLDTIRRKLADVVWDDSRPSCMVQDIALASLSDEVAFDAVPASQTPGFLSFKKSGH